MYTLLTGATGLVGRYLVRDLLLNGHHLVVVVRPSRKASPRDRMEQILQHWEEELGRPLPRPVVLSGDIAEPAFGMSDADQAWVKQNVNTIIHSAAILEFYGEDRNGEPWRTNLGGTRNMINLCRDLQIHDINYISTAYVAGMQTEPAMEDALDVGQKFRNDYEESKFLAEQEVRAIDFAEHVTVYRPAVISGDSVTGYTNTYHGIYLYLRLMAVMIPSIPAGEDGFRHTPIRLRFTGDERRNVIPVDWISAVTVRLFETPEARGGTYHMAPEDPMIARDMINWCGEYFKSTGVEFRGTDFVPEPVSRENNEDQWMFERLVMENMGTYEPYESTDNTFDMTNLKRFAGDIVCPPIDKTVIQRYIQFGEEDRWGKRRPEALKNKAWAESLFEALPEHFNGPEEAVLGLDIHGEGGSQWTLRFGQGTQCSMTRGLPAEGTPTLCVQLSELLALRNGDQTPASLAKSINGGVPESLLNQLQDLLSQTQLAITS